MHAKGSTVRPPGDGDGSDGVAVGEHAVQTLREGHILEVCGNLIVMILWYAGKFTVRTVVLGCHNVELV